MINEKCAPHKHDWHKLDKFKVENTSYLVLYCPYCKSLEHHIFTHDRVGTTKLVIKKIPIKEVVKNDEKMDES